MRALFCEIIKAHHYAIILIFLCCFGIYSDFSYFFSQFFQLLGWFLEAVLVIFAVSLWLGSCFVDFSGFSYFFRNFSGCFAVVGELFCGFQQFQLLFSRIFPAFGLDWGAVLEVLWITATQGLPEISLRVLPL